MAATRRKLVELTEGLGVSEADYTLGGGLPADTEEDARTVHREQLDMN